LRCRKLPGLSRDEREDLSYFILKGRDDLGIGVIWIQHDMQMVAHLTDRIHVLDYGRSLADGHPDEVLKMKKSSKPISAKLE